MKIRHSLLLLAVAAQGALAQSTPAPQATACSTELAWMADWTSRNYSGFELKVADTLRAHYDALLSELQPEAGRASSGAECDAVLRRYVAFFRDGHLSFGRDAGAPSSAGAGESPDAIRARFADWERIDLSEDDARRRLEASGRNRSPVEGIYESLDGRYRVAVLRDAREGRDYTMTILRADSIWWMPGQMKATLAEEDGVYATRFYMLDHSEREWKGEMHRNILHFDSGSQWVRVWPVAPGDVSRESLAAAMNTRFAAREIAPGTMLLQIPTFGNPRAMDSLWEAARERVLSSERLIIDLRNNGGGSDYNFRNLIPLIYTNPIHIRSNSALATPENIQAHERLAADTTFPAAQRMQMRQTIEALKKAEGRWHVWNDRVHEERTVLERPGEVAIVINRGCASSCEQFILAALQSSKVTLYGDRTAGILDFGNVRRARMPGSDLVLDHPTTRSNRLPDQPVDPMGIQPHVRIPDGEPFPLEWVLNRMDSPSSAGAK